MDVVFEKFTEYWVLVIHTYNPSYSGVRNQEGQVLKSDLANSSQDPISKKKKEKNPHKKGLVVWFKV
jgi:hypothetical protein